MGTPDGVDPIADSALPFIERPQATHTIVVDLAQGLTVARIPGTYVGFQLIQEGAVVASNQGVAVIESPPHSDQ